MIGNSNVGQYVNKNENSKGTLNAKIIDMMSSKILKWVLTSCQILYQLFEE